MAELESLVFRLCLKVGPIFFPKECFPGNQYKNQKKSEADLFEAAEWTQSCDDADSPGIWFRKHRNRVPAALSGLDVHQASHYAKCRC